jgi:hypothetical protein
MQGTPTDWAAAVFWALAGLLAAAAPRTVIRWAATWRYEHPPQPRPAYVLLIRLIGVAMLLLASWFTWRLVR